MCSLTWKLSILLDFLEALLRSHCWLNYWPLVTELSPQPLPSLEMEGSGEVVVVWGRDFQSHPLITGWFPWKSAPFFSKSPLINLNSSRVRRGLLWITKDPFHLYFRNPGQKTKYYKTMPCLEKFEGLGELRGSNKEQMYGQRLNMYFLYFFKILFLRSLPPS